MNNIITLIVAVDADGGFGRKGKIPWRFKEDFKRFQRHTKGGICVMGRKTYDDMKNMADARGRDITDAILPNRTSYVISDSKPESYFVGCKRVSGLREVMNEHPDQEIFVLGGERLFTESIAMAHRVLITAIDKFYGCDRFFPIDYLAKRFFINDCDKYTAESGTDLYFTEYHRIPHR
jgi:dihydrofolate reductase